jgi:hypothetical protein
MNNQEEMSARIAQMIRSRSKAGQVIEAQEIRKEILITEVSGSEEGDTETLTEDTFKQALEDHPDLRKISGQQGHVFYHSTESLSESYAAILMWKSEDPLRMIAEVVRENSRVYPRPVPQDSFQGPPFGLTEEQIAECLAAMAEQEEYRDIAHTTTSIGTAFLFSTAYLDRDHADMLAEWLDVGQSANP